MKNRSFLAWLPVVFSLAMGLFAQDEPVQRPDLVLSFEVRMITVETRVTDRKGNPVTGLTEDDFELLVDGEPVAIDHFSERIATVSTPTAEELAVAEDPDALAAISTADPDELAGRSLYKGNSYLVFIDDYFTTRYYRRPLFKRLVQDLTYLGPDDRMAIVRYDGKRLEVISDWTDDRNLLEASFQTAMKRKSGELLRESRLEVNANPDARAKILADQVDRTARATAIAMRSFHNPPGRKLLLLASQGWSSTSVSVPLNVPDAWSGGRTRRRALDIVTDTANQVGYTIYPLILAQSPLLFSAEDAAPPSSQDLYNSAQGYRDLTDPFHQIAHSTGGRVIPKAFTQTEPFKTVAVDSSSFYVLGFQRGNDDGKRHKIRVRLKRPDLKVRHRRDFRMQRASESADMMLEASLLLGSSGPGLDISFGEASRYRFRKIQVPTAVKIPMEWVTMIPLGNDRYTCKMELRISAEDARGSRAEISVVPIVLQGGPPPDDSYATCEVDLLLRRGKQRLVFSLRDINSGETLNQVVEFKP